MRSRSERRIFLQFTGGAGDDLFKITGAELAAGDVSIDGGAGNDTVELFSTNDYSATDGDFLVLTSIETLEIASAAGVTAGVMLGATASAEVG